MKIACVIHSLDGGGAERVMAGLCSQLTQRQHDVTLITLDDGGADRHELSPEVQCQRLDVMRVSRSWADRLFNTRERIAAIRQAIDRSNCDVVLSFCDRTNVLTLMAAHTLPVPIVVSERSDPSQQYLGRTWEYLRRRNYRRAAAVIALTESSADSLRATTGADVQVIPSAVDPPPLTSDRERANQNRLVMGIGRLEREKGFDRLIDAFAANAQAAPDWTLRILGEGSQRPALQSQIESLGLADRVSLPGWIRPVWDELAGATLFALPSRYEGFPSALLEAMAIGVPSIAVDCPSGPREIISDGCDGVLVANETAALSAAIGQLIAQKAQRETLGRQGMSVVDRFGFTSMVDAYEAVLRKVVQ